MNLRLVRLSQAFKSAQRDLVEAFGKTVAESLDAPGYWRIVTQVSDCNARLDTSRFFKSIEENVDDEDKRTNFSTMLHALFRAAKLEDYGNELAVSAVKRKEAHGFKYGGSSHKIWELKQGKKDRIYFFTMSRQFQGEKRNFIVLLLAQHKNTQTTPDEVKRHSEKVMKSCLDPREDLNICKESS